jgi:hypothetical protein
MFAFSGQKVRSLLAALCRGSATIVSITRGRMGRELLSTSSGKTSPGVKIKQSFRPTSFPLGWTSNGRCAEEVWNNFKSVILDSIKNLFNLKY